MIGWPLYIFGSLINTGADVQKMKEQAMAAKYPEFAAYQQNSSRLLPWIW